jgi:hypothetical protein
VAVKGLEGMSCETRRILKEGCQRIEIRTLVFQLSSGSISMMNAMRNGITGFNTSKSVLTNELDRLPRCYTSSLYPRSMSLPFHLVHLLTDLPPPSLLPTNRELSSEFQLERM